MHEASNASRVKVPADHLVCARQVARGPFCQETPESRGQRSRNNCKNRTNPHNRYQRSDRCKLTGVQTAEQLGVFGKRTTKLQVPFDYRLVRGKWCPC